jgi:hypothetical protein
MIEFMLCSKSHVFKDTKSRRREENKSETDDQASKSRGKHELIERISRRKRALIERMSRRKRALIERMSRSEHVPQGCRMLRTLMVGAARFTRTWMIDTELRLKSIASLSGS